MKKSVFRMPVPVKITGRTSAITNSFANGIIPVMQPTEEEIRRALEALGMKEETICCAYCGGAYTEWDHLRPLIRKKRPTGYISEIHNLVPACGKCNQSKGNREWREWAVSDAPLSPRSRGVSDLDERMRRLEEYERTFEPVRIDFAAVVGAERWERHWKNCEELHAAMRACQQSADELRDLLAKSVERERQA